MSLKLNGLRLAPVLWSALAGLAGCAPSQDIPSPSAGSFDASSYVAVGDSYSSGFSAGGLTRNGQLYSFPALVARQVRQTGAAAAFPQNLLLEGAGTGYLVFSGFDNSLLPKSRRVAGQASTLYIDPNGCAGPDTVRQFARTDGAVSQHLGIPGLRLGQIETLNYGNASQASAGARFNPYFERMLPANTSTTYLQAVTAAAASATFFTYFAGLDDFLPFVRSGGTCRALPTGTSLNNNAKKVLDVLTTNNRKGIVAQLPPLASLPLLSLGRADSLQNLYLAQGDTAHVYVFVSAFQSAEKAEKTDFILAPAVARLGQLMPVLVNGQVLQLRYGRDSRNPVADADVIDRREYELLDVVRKNHNNYLITLTRDTYRMPVLTASTRSSVLNLDNEVFFKISSKLSIGGVSYSDIPVRGGLFSLDYYSFTPRGNGLLANAFIRALNIAYGANIPAVDINALPTTAQ